MNWSRVRASLVMPLIATRGRECRVPGGCAIGTRPVDLLIMALESRRRSVDRGYVIARAKRTAGRRDQFSKVTVGGTHTALMAASLARAPP
jgi:UDP-N-acetylglucosamine 1-carboxyvinyltransferase